MISAMSFLCLPSADVIGFISENCYSVCSLSFILRVKLRLWTGPKLIPHLMRILSSVVILTFCMMLLMSQATNLYTAAGNRLQFGLHSYRQKLPFFGDHQHCVYSGAV